MNAHREIRWLALACGFAALCGAPASADIYEWTADDGSAHYTDVFELVPAQYRAGVRITKGENAGAPQQVAPAAPAAPAQTPAATAAPAEPAAIAGLTEAQWRAEAERLDALITALEPEAKRCEGDHINLSPGDGSRKRAAELAEAEACVKTRKELADAHADRETLDENAHRGDVPPGWVRGD